MKKVNLFFNKYILHGKEYYLSLQQSDTDLLQRVQYKDCPIQKNGHDCGIFAVAAILHLAEQIPLTSKSFSQTHVTKARFELAKTLCSDSALSMTSAVFQDHFPLLCDRSILHDTGVEVINNRGVDGSAKPTAPPRRSTRSTNPILSDEGNGLSRSTAIALCWQEDIALGNVYKVTNHTSTTKETKALHANKKREHQEINLTSATSKDDANNNEEGMTTRDKKISTSASMKESGNACASTKEEGGDAGNNKQMTLATALYRIMHKAKLTVSKIWMTRFLSLKNMRNYDAESATNPAICC